MTEEHREVLIAEGIRNVCFRSVYIGTAKQPASSKGLNQPKLELYRSHVTRADVKKVWSYISIPPLVIMMCIETKLTVLPYSKLSMSWSVHVGFVADTVPIRPFFSPCSLALPCHCHSTNSPYSIVFIHHRCYIISATNSVF